MNHNPIASDVRVIHPLILQKWVYFIFQNMSSNALR